MSAREPAGPAPVDDPEPAVAGAARRVTGAGARDATRQRLLLAAAEVFAARGFEAATVEDILRAARLSRRTFYQCFDDKQDVLRELYLRSTERLLAAFRAQAPAHRGAARVLAALEAWLGFVAGSAPVVRVLAIEALRPAGPLAARRRALHQHIVDLYEDGYAPRRAPDPLLLRSAVLLAESLCVHLLTETPARPADLKRTRAALRVAVGRMLEPSHA